MGEPLLGLRRAGRRQDHARLQGLQRAEGESARCSATLRGCGGRGDATDTATGAGTPGQCFNHTTGELTTCTGEAEIRGFFEGLFEVLSDTSDLAAPVIETTEAPLDRQVGTWHRGRMRETDTCCRPTSSGPAPRPGSSAPRTPSSTTRTSSSSARTSRSRPPPRPAALSGLLPVPAN